MSKWNDVKFCKEMYFAISKIICIISTDLKKSYFSSKKKKIRNPSSGPSDTFLTPLTYYDLKKCSLYLYFRSSHLYHLRAGLSLTGLALHLPMCLINYNGADKNNIGHSQDTPVPQCAPDTRLHPREMSPDKHGSSEPCYTHCKQGRSQFEDTASHSSTFCLVKQSGLE